MITLGYGALPDQVGDLYPPADADAPLVCLLHGGFWRMPYGRDQLDPLAQALHHRGHAVWNIGYRRVGEGGTPWPATLDDVRAALAFLPTLARQHPPLSLRRTFVLGHSAGGHLAFWAATQARQLGWPTALAGVIGLAPILDLEDGFRRDLGTGAVGLFVEGDPAAVPDRYAAASPRAHLPLGVPQWILHGSQDTAVPPVMSRDYAEAARAKGDQVYYKELADVGHMELIEPGSPAFPLLQQYLSAT